jgi:hypothetical protein
VSANAVGSVISAMVMSVVSSRLVRIASVGVGSDALGSMDYGRSTIFSNCDRLIR